MGVLVVVLAVLLAFCISNIITTLTTIFTVGLASVSLYDLTLMLILLVCTIISTFIILKYIQGINNDFIRKL